MPCNDICSTPPSSGKKPDYPKKNGKQPDKIKSEVAFLKKLKEKPGDLATISTFVKAHKNQDYEIEENPQVIMRVCDLNGTDYMGQTYTLDSWQSLYLSKETKMEVLGAIDNYYGLQLVILVAEDGRVYAYEEERMFLISKSVPEFIKHGRNKNPEVYELQRLSDEEYEAHSNDEEVLKIRQRTRDFVNSHSEAFDDMLDFF